MVVLTALPNPLEVVSHCKVFIPFTTQLAINIFYRICWPFDVDQPLAAAHLTENLNVAFELIQVRIGEELKPIHRNGLAPQGTREAVGIEIRQTIDMCHGEKGQELRRNAEQFKVKFAKAWEQDGIASREIHEFLHKYT